MHNSLLTSFAKRNFPYYPALSEVKVDDLILRGAKRRPSEEQRAARREKLAAQAGSVSAPPFLLCGEPNSKSAPGCTVTVDRPFVSHRRTWSTPSQAIGTAELNRWGSLAVAENPPG